MQAKKRYILVFVSCAFLAYCYFGGYRLKTATHRRRNSGLPSSSSSIADSDSETLDQLPSFVTSDVGRDYLHSIKADVAELVHKSRNSGLSASKPAAPAAAIDQQLVNSNSQGSSATSSTTMRTCRMETCFDFSKCYNEFLIYVYPPEPLNSLGAAPPISPNYQKIITAIQESRYYTPDPQKACLFVLGIDTLDRDSLSEDYVRNVPSRLARLPHWNNGRNHVIFNLYSGTWPDYVEHSLGFDTGEAILAKASMSIQHVRHGFDISIPLFHKQFPLRAGSTGLAPSMHFPSNKKYLLAFKGKRYVHGIGSETRNSLFHLHNGRDIILVTTCRHGKSWRELQDARCDEDNREYDRYDYETLLLNSTFCLVPRGRRLGSFRFLEAIQAGCIPVLLSNDWVLPFESKIDWKQAAVWADERLLLQVPEVVRSISDERIFALRQQTQVLWERYFGSIEKIVFTTFEIIRERLPHYPERNSIVWNTAPGALLTLPTFADSSRFMPFLLDDINLRTRDNYTAVIYVQIGAPLGPNNALYKLVKTITKSQFVDRIIVLWAADRPIPAKKRWPPTYHIPFHVISLGSSYQTKSAAAAAAASAAVLKGGGGDVGGAGADNARNVENDGALNGRSASQHKNHNYNDNKNRNNAHSPDGDTPTDNDADATDERPSISQRFYPYDEIQTDAVLSLDEDAILNTDELDFAYTVWRDFPDRIVGYPARAHFWDDSKNAWGYTSKWTNYYSIVLTGAAFYHRYYNYLYTNWLSLLLLKTVQQSSNCEDILMNFLVSHVTRKAPIKVTQRKGYKDRETGRSPWNDPDHFIQRQSCLNTFAAVFGYMPLVRSNMRLDPILYRDPVSNLRKKYRQIELVGS
ncbi:exostosin glycosyltransferase 1 ttv [Musca autumnalis]|uniref:exostosin glycosyltransferase 1 ttv n=1 Tax=Musca autumnalis TaxID=221902 RepID=UPI003CECEF7B